MEFIFIPIIAAIIGACVAAAKGRSAFGWFILCLFFPFLLLVILCLPSVRPQANIVQQVVYVQQAPPIAPAQAPLPPTIEAQRVEPRLTRGGFFS